MSQKSYNGQASLYLIPTPIGNLEDITIRALNLLKSVDIILCEDTRVTGSLLKKYEIKNKLMSCHEYNEQNIKEKVIEELKAGKTIGLVTDQGSPIISDPGYIISHEVINQGYNVIGLPGATAFVPALISSGLNPSPFLFYGFLNAKIGKQKQELEKLKKIESTLIFYEAPHRIMLTLQNIREVLGNRKICLTREISKLYEEIYRGSVEQVIKEIESGIKGEIVLIVEGNQEIIDYSNISVLEHVQLYLEDGLSEKEAIKLVSKERNVAKSIIYKEYHDIKNGNNK